MAEHIVKTTSGRIIADPPLARFLFSDTRFAPIWTIIRVLIGYSWITAGWGKLHEASWMVTGVRASGLLDQRGRCSGNGSSRRRLRLVPRFPPGMLNNGSYVWFAKLIAFGEFFVGLASDRRWVRRHRRLFRRADELELHHGWLDQQQPAAPDRRHRPHPRLEDRWLLWTGLLPSAPARHTLVTT